MLGNNKREAPAVASESPKRGREEVLTMAMLQSVLKQQTEELRVAQQKDLHEVAQRLELSTKQQIGEIKHEVQSIKADLGQQGGLVKDLQDNLRKLENRLSEVETNVRIGSATASTADIELDRPKPIGVVVGGWPADTRKDDLLKYGRSALERIDAAKYLDGELFCTGVRRGFLLSNMKVRPNETPEIAKARVGDFVKTVNDAQLHAEGMSTDGKLWGARSRTRAERQKTAHACKMRKVFHLTNGPAVRELECEYGSGTVFHGSLTIGSAVRARPAQGNIAHGRGPGTWVNLDNMAKVAGKSVDEIRQIWESAIAY